jgi:hypothetical protein
LKYSIANRWKGGLVTATGPQRNGNGPLAINFHHLLSVTVDLSMDGGNGSANCHQHARNDRLLPASTPLINPFIHPICKQEIKPHHS